MTNNTNQEDEMTQTKTDRIIIKGNGNQAPYGIGEHITDFANTPAGAKKAVRYAKKWYNKPNIWIGEQQYTIDPTPDGAGELKEYPY